LFQRPNERFHQGELAAEDFQNSSSLVWWSRSIPVELASGVTVAGTVRPWAVPTVYVSRRPLAGRQNGLIIGHGHCIIDHMSWPFADNGGGHMTFRFKFERSLQAAGVLLGLDGNRMQRIRLLKPLYIADRELLSETGRTITGDRGVDMDHGPVLARRAIRAGQGIRRNCGVGRSRPLLP
jgi:hypothetical protein